MQRERQPVKSPEESIHDLELYREQLDANLQMGLASAFEADLQNWMEEQGSPESTAEDEYSDRAGSQLQDQAECPPPESSSKQWQGGFEGTSGSLAQEVSEEDSEPESDREEETEYQGRLLEKRNKVSEYSDTESGELVDEEDDERPQTKKPRVEEGESEDDYNTVKKKVEEGEVEEGELSSDDSSEKVSKVLPSFHQTYLLHYCFHLLVVYLATGEPELKGYYLLRQSCSAHG